MNFVYVCVWGVCVCHLLNISVKHFYLNMNLPLLLPTRTILPCATLILEVFEESDFSDMA